MSMLNRRLRSPNKNRLPPGQYEARGWPTLHFGGVPRRDLKTWTFRIFGAVAEEKSFTYDEFRALTTTTLRADFHCVTKFSVFDNDWEGIRVRDVLAQVERDPAVSHVLVHALDGYTANLPLEVFDDDDTIFAWGRNGQDLTPGHGWPLRLVVPKRYAWKSVKWANGLELLTHDIRGFWEDRGYHNNADPWKEERFSYQELG